MVEREAKGISMIGFEEEKSSQWGMGGKYD